MLIGSAFHVYTYFWVNIHQILVVCCVCGKTLATAALLCSAVQDRDMVPTVRKVILCGRGACWSVMFVYSSLETCGAEPKTTDTGTRNKLMDNCLSSLTYVG